MPLRPILVVLTVFFIRRTNLPLLGVVVPDLEARELHLDQLPTLVALVDYLVGALPVSLDRVVAVAGRHVVGRLGHAGGVGGVHGDAVDAHVAEAALEKRRKAAEHCCCVLKSFPPQFED